MSEIGSGSGSSYPGTLDTNSTPEVNSPSASKTKARAEVPNDLAACIVAIETELGTDPAGSLTDVKTFLQTEHSAAGAHTTNSIAEKTAGSGVTVDGMLIKDGGISDGTNIIKTKILSIGDWNMDANNTTTVAHGLTFAKIRGVSAIISNDTSALFTSLDGTYIGTAGGACQADATNITLSRTVSGFFDDVNYDSTSFNRGYIIITYVV